MSIFKSNFEIKKGSERNFGVVFSIIFFLFGFWPILNNENVNLILLFIGLTFLIAAFLIPKIFYYPNFVWFKIGIYLSLIVSPIVMAFIYYFVFCPIGLWIQIRGENREIQLKFDKSIDSYWIERSEEMGSMKNQF